VLGLVITMLSVTGVYIWWKKRPARQFSKAHCGGAAEAARIEDDRAKAYVKSSRA
jgi:uncharacterized iron-regulated membrane protein